MRTPDGDRAVPALYYAFRQAKIALFFERRGVGLIELGGFEADLGRNLRRLHETLSSNGGWFDGLPRGSVWVLPKRLRQSAPTSDQEVRIGVPAASSARPVLDVQLRLMPTPEFAIVEVLYIWRYGPILDRLLSRHAVGYRLDLRDGKISRTRRWLFEYWPKRYEEFRTAPVDAARQRLRASDEPVTILSADLASYYDTIGTGFLLSSDFIQSLTTVAEEAEIQFDPEEYVIATSSLINSISDYRRAARQRIGGDWSTGIPIGPLTSRIIANLALEPLDRWISSSPTTICYRRYVDDFVAVVADSTLPEKKLPEALEVLLPLSRSGGDAYRLNATELGREDCEFEIQPMKVRVHHLAGLPGEQFLKAVGDDFRRLVSERRAFLDGSTMLEEVASHLTRAGKADGSPLRVLRDADRVRLEHFALSTSLASLDRVSTMVDPEQARNMARETQLQIGRALDGEDDWVTQFELLLRLLRLSIATDDLESVLELINRMDESWGSIDGPESSRVALAHRGREILTTSARTWLRNYVHERRLETLARSYRRGQRKALQSVLQRGIKYRSSRVGWRAVASRAGLLADSDLRTCDREDDGFRQSSDVPVDASWLMHDLSEESALVECLAKIGEFVEKCVEQGGSPWAIPPARLFLCTRPPSYFDIARRWLYRVELDGFESTTFDRLLQIVNSIRGTEYYDPVGTVIDASTVEIGLQDHAPRLWSRNSMSDPTLVLGNLVCSSDYWKKSATRLPGSATGPAVHSLKRLQALATIVEQAHEAVRGNRARGSRINPGLLLLPELSLPRKWFRTLANHLVNVSQLGLVAGLEYLHDPKEPFVLNQVFAVLPGPFGAVATWPWTKRLPARREMIELANCKPPLKFKPIRASRHPRPVVKSAYGVFSVLICSEMLEARRVADLLNRVEVVLVPAWNVDISSYDHLIQTVGVHLHGIIGIANNGEYSDCRVWAPRRQRFERELCRLISRGANEIVSVRLPLADLRSFRSGVEKNDNWRPLPPDWT